MDLSSNVCAVDDLPEWEFVFRFTPGRLCLAFVATVGERWRRSFERLRCTGDLARWVVQAELVDTEPAVSDGQLAEARQLREAIYRSVRAGMAGERSAHADRMLLNAWAARPDLAPQLAEDGTRTTWQNPDQIVGCLATVARDAVLLLSSSELSRVRECSAADCALLFVDHSRPGRRKWCDDGACGSRSRSAAYRSRRQSLPASPAAQAKRGPGSP